jgi:hypothetical protein
LWILKSFFMQSPPASRHFILLGSEYSPRHPVLVS